MVYMAVPFLWIGIALGNNFFKLSFFPSFSVNLKVTISFYSSFKFSNINTFSLGILNLSSKYPKNQSNLSGKIKDANKIILFIMTYGI